MSNLIRILALALVLLTLGPAVAHAGLYSVSSCNDVRGSDGWSPQASYYVGAYPECRVMSNAGAPALSNGRVVFTAPPGTAVVGIRGAFTSTQQGGWQVGIYDFDASSGGRQWLWCGPNTNCITFGTAPGFAADSFRSSRIGVFQICGADPCGGPSNFRASNVILTIADSSPPGLSVNVPGGWLRGTQPITIDANDNVGIKSTPLYIDGQARGGANRTCDYSRAIPCPNGANVYNLNTADVPDGAHKVTVEAVDAADNASSVDRPIYVDNTAPGQIGEPAVEGGDGWRPVNKFALSWVTPPQSAAPIAAVEYELCPTAAKPGDPACQRGSRPAEDFAPKATEGDPATRRSVLEGVEVPKVGEWTASIWLRDQAGNQNQQTAKTVTLRFDNAPPVVAFRQFDPADPTRLRVQGSDRPSGIARAAIELQRSGEATWRPLDVQLEDGGFAASLDDANLPDGVYALRARAVDQAGNERSTEAFADGKPATVGLPVRIKTRLAVGKPKKVPIKRRPKGSKRSYRTRLVTRPRVNYGRPLRLQGRLTTPGQNPLTGTEVQIFEQTQAPGAKPRPIGTVTTSRTGRFSFKIAKGPSRIVSFRYPGTRTIRAGLGEVALQVRSSTSFAVSRRSVVNGQAVTFRGHLRGGHIPAEGKIIALQVLSRGRWRPFATTRANAQSGRWTYVYRFDGTRGRIRYRFRVRVLREATYPFSTGTSGNRRVLVRGSRR
jgi:hypothetical protein